MEHLISDQFFQSIASNGILLLIVAGAIAVLGKGADWVVEGASHLAYQLGIGKIIVGATIVSLGTTTPEAAVSVMAAFDGKSDHALGNAVGSIICDTALIFGLACTLTRLPIDRYILNRQGWVQFGCGAGLVGFCILGRFSNPTNPVLSSEVGYFFLFLLTIYLFASIYWARTHGSRDPEAQQNRATLEFLQVAKFLGMVVVGLVIVLLSSRVLIGSVTELALRWDIPKSIIAATLVAFGTSLPELVTALVAIKKGHTDLVIGNVVGADVLNVLFVAGASAAASPLQIPDHFFKIHFPALIIVLLIFRIFISIGKESFERWMGIPLIASYVIYIYLQY